MSIIVHNYYDLVAGLPDILLQEPRVPVSAAAFIEELYGLVPEDDAQLLNIIRLPFDNKNLITILESRDREFEPGGNYSQEQLLHEIKESDTLPGYMRELIAASRDGRQLFPGLSLEDQLNWLFYDEATGHENAFIADWFTFELNLRNILAGLNLRTALPHLGEGEPEHDRGPASYIICRNEVAEALLKSTATDFGLLQLFPWIEKVLLFPVQDSTERQQCIDRLRWEVLDDLTTFTYFQIETILAFCIKLTLVERWIKLRPAEGKRKLETLVGELTETFLTGNR
jgi:hypothetical protein